MQFAEDECGPDVAARQVHVFGTLVLDSARLTAAAGPEQVSLSRAEFATLSVLVGRRHAPMSRESIVQALLLDGVEMLPRMVDVLVCRLRQKLAPLGIGAVIMTAWGRGYLAGLPPREDEAPAEPPGGGSIAALLTA